MMEVLAYFNALSLEDNLSHSFLSKFLDIVLDVASTTRGVMAMLLVEVFGFAQRVR